MEPINRLDLKYNDRISVKVTSDTDMPKHTLQMAALEALLTDMSMDRTQPGGDPYASVEAIIRELLDRTEQPNLKRPAAHEYETLIERFKRYYSTYRTTSEPDISFTSAYDELTLTVIHLAETYAEHGDVESIRNMLREYREIRSSITPSNDSVKERFEREYVQREQPVT